MKQQELGIKLTELRKAKGLTQEDLAAKCNINVRTLQRIEAGEVIPRSYTLQAILSVLEVGYSEFIGQFSSNYNIQEEFQCKPIEKTNALKNFIETWSFALYIVLLLIFSCLIKFGMPWYYYILPVLVIYLINTNEQELETN